jgi:hypothetical protein
VTGGLVNIVTLREKPKSVNIKLWHISAIGSELDEYMVLTKDMSKV